MEVLVQEVKKVLQDENMNGRCIYGIKNRYLEVEEKVDVLIQFSSTV